MTAQELINELQKLDPTQTVNIAIRTFTQAHDVAYTETRIAGNVIFACLPEGYVVSNRNPKTGNPLAEKYAITPASLDVFKAYAEDGPNWSGTPLVGGNVGGGKEERGNLTQLKQAGLITTFRDDERKDLTWLQFTAKGLELAKELGIDTGR